ncbi:MAG: Leucine-rich repeat (LRR) protein [Bacillariaceae sp.]
MDFSNSAITSLPDYIIDRLQNLRELILSGTKKLNSIPDLDGLQKLEVLDLSYSGISLLPDSLTMLLSLNNLNFAYMKKLESLPDIEIGDLTNVQRFDASASSISSLSNVGKLVNLKDLILGEVDFQLHNSLSDAVGILTKLARTQSMRFKQHITL